MGRKRYIQIKILRPEYESYVSAAEQAIEQGAPHQSLEQIVFTVTIIARILLFKVALSPYLIEKRLQP